VPHLRETPDRMLFVMPHRTAPSTPPALCRICGIRPADSDEHFIPKAAGNRRAVRLLVQEPDGSQRERRCTGGFFLPVLCKQCNSSPAGGYAQAYTVLFRQLREAPSLTAEDGRLIFHARDIFPLRFVKQCILAFICAAPWYPEPVWRPLQAFLRDRDALLPDTAPRIFLYENIANIGRVVPSCGICELANHRTTVVSEISWPPLGIVLSFQAHPVLSQMADITEWGQYAYSHRASVQLRLPRLQVNTLYPLAFGTARAVKARDEVLLPLYLFHAPPTSSSPTKLCTLLRRG
jgi:hypothetical protein